LLDAARAAKERAYAPYSEFRVGAALRSTDGRIFTGCNVENASYPVGLCAERVALGTAVASGARRFGRLAIASDAATPTPPCGMTSREGACVSWRLEDLLPAHFELQDRGGEGADG
jgi:cytidine deaminase